jgi:hypothetical protein
MKKWKRWWYAVILGAIMFSVWGIVELHPFLAVNRPINAEILVVEGWVPLTYIPLVVEEFRRGNYRSIVTVGGPLPSRSWGYPESNAERAAQILIKMGIKDEIVTAVPVPPVNRYKTRASAWAFRDWLMSSGQTIQSVNVFTVDVHARKSQLLFQRSLGPTKQVGVIAAKEQKYDPAHWWLSPTGIYLVTKNSVAYLDALLLTGND